MGKMQELFQPFIATDAKKNWEGYTSPRMDYFGGVPGETFDAGFLVATREGYMDIPHIHDGADNFFILTGPDLTDVFHSEFEAVMFLGDSPTEMEAYRITKPSVVKVPAGTWHCPLYYKTVRGGINTVMWYAGQSTGRVYPTDDGKDIRYEKDNWTRPCVKDPEKLCTWCGACFTQTEEHVRAYMKPFFENAAKTRKYADCILELKPDFHGLGDKVRSPRIACRGGEDLPGLDRQFSFNIVDRPCTLGDETVSNGREAEYLWFSGADAVDPWHSFDGEIEVLLGEDPEHMEPVIIDRPGVVALPPGFWRGPVTVKCLGKPLCFIPWYPSKKPRYKVTQKVLGGEKVLVYGDRDTIGSPTESDELYLQRKR